MNEKPNIVKLKDVARVIPMPLSMGTRELLQIADKEYVYIDNTKKDAIIMSQDDILSRESKAKAFTFIVKNCCMAQYLQYILNTVPNKRLIEKARESRNLSTPVLNQLNIPIVSISLQDDIIELVELSQVLGKRLEWDIYAELGRMCLQEISIAINTELFLNELCVENRIHILDSWSNLIHQMPQERRADIIPQVLLSTGNPLMAEVRSLQRILVHTHKNMNDGLQN